MIPWKDPSHLENLQYVFFQKSFVAIHSSHLFGQFRSIGLQQYLSTSVHSTWDDVQKSQWTSNWSVNGCVCYITLCKSWEENESSNIPPLQLGTDVALRLQWCPSNVCHMFDPTILVPEKKGEAHCCNAWDTAWQNDCCSSRFQAHWHSIKTHQNSNISQATKNSMLTIAMSCSSRFLSGFKRFGSAKI